MPLRSDTSQRYPSLPLLSNTELKVQANVIRQLKEMSIQIGKEDIQLCLFIDDRIVYIEKPKELTTKIEIISNDCKVEGFKVNYKSQLLSFILTIKKWNLKFKKRILSTLTAPEYEKHPP